jgi:hypothetical protein
VISLRNLRVTKARLAFSINAAPRSFGGAALIAQLTKAQAQGRLAERLAPYAKAQARAQRPWRYVVDDVLSVGSPSPCLSPRSSTTSAARCGIERAV